MQSLLAEIANVCVGSSNPSAGTVVFRHAKRYSPVLVSVLGPVVFI